MECAGNGRLDTKPLPIGEPWGGYAVSTSHVDWHAVERNPSVDRLPKRVPSRWYAKEPTMAPTTSTTTSSSSAHCHSICRWIPAADILVAYEMNGEPLNADHGAPFRLIVPHWYGVASVKWLARIEVVTEPYQGEFQTSHYMYEWPDRPHEPVDIMLVRARITDPAPGVTIPNAPYTVRGKAWSGAGPITKVEISFTGEGEWYVADLASADDPYAWQDWSVEWTPSKSGRHSIRARATDAAGNVQPDVPALEPAGIRKQCRRSTVRRSALTILRAAWLRA